MHACTTMLARGLKIRFVAIVGRSDKRRTEWRSKKLSYTQTNEAAAQASLSAPVNWCHSTKLRASVLIGVNNPLLSEIWWVIYVDRLCRPSATTTTGLSHGKLLPAIMIVVLVFDSCLVVKEKFISLPCSLSGAQFTLNLFPDVAVPLLAALPSNSLPRRP